MATVQPQPPGLAALRPLLLRPGAKVILFALAMLPFAWLFYGVWTNNLGANPTEYLTRATGDWTLRFLCLTLLVTPLRSMSGTPQLARFRRMLGLFVYFYAVLHLLCCTGRLSGALPPLSKFQIRVVPPKI